MGYGNLKRLIFGAFLLCALTPLVFAGKVEHIVSYDARMNTKEDLKRMAPEIFAGDDIVVKYYPSSIFDPYNVEENSFLLKTLADKKNFVSFVYPRYEETNSTPTLQAVRPQTFYAVTDQEDTPFQMIVLSEGSKELGRIAGKQCGARLQGKLIVLSFDVTALPEVNFQESDLLLKLRIIPVQGSDTAIQAELPIRMANIKQNVRLRYQEGEAPWKEIPFDFNRKQGLPYGAAKITDLAENVMYQSQIVYEDAKTQKDIFERDPIKLYSQSLPSRLRIRAGPVAIGDGRRTFFAAHLLLLLDERSLDQNLPLTPFHNN